MIVRGQFPDLELDLDISWVFDTLIHYLKIYLLVLPFILSSATVITEFSHPNFSFLGAPQFRASVHQDDAAAVHHPVDGMKAAGVVRGGGER